MLFVCEIFRALVVREKHGNIGAAETGSAKLLHAFFHGNPIRIDAEDCRIFASHIYSSIARQSASLGPFWPSVALLSNKRANPRNYRAPRCACEPAGPGEANVQR